MAYQLIGVVGAGAMGRGLAQSLAVSGLDVVLVDVSDSILKAARREIASALRLSGLYGPEISEAEATVALGRIKTALCLEELADCDFLIENITERLDLKAELYPRLDRVLHPSAPLAANTSVIPITRIASWTSRPEKVLGMHFMNPVPLKPVVEVIRGVLTSDDTLTAARTLLKQMKKKAVVVADAPGFVSNRVLMLTINEAIWLVADGVAEAPEVDRIFRSCFGHPMGPLATGDMIGLDTILLSLEGLLAEYNDPKFRPCPLLRRMVDAGFYGRKNGRGFYEYIMNEDGE